MADNPAPRRTLRILFVEDSEDDTALIVRQLERVGYHVQHQRVETRAAFEDAIDTARWDAIISDHSMPHFSSMDALALIRERDIDWPFIIVSGTIGEDAAVAAMRAGAHDYVLKSNLARLVPAIEREVVEASLRRQAREEREARRGVELQLQHAQKMEAVGRLAGGIAHDFNNLLTAVLGFTGIALDKIAEGADVTHELEQVHEAAQRAGRLTRQLLAFSRQQVLDPRVLDPVDAIQTMTPMLRRLMGEDVDIETTGARGHVLVKIDPGQFEQVIMNLAVNARDAMPRGGTFRIDTSRVDLDRQAAARQNVEPGPYVMVAASDTGHGIDESVRARIFEPFFTTKRSGEGTGLGLSMVFGILTQTGGTIDVDSQIGVGTTFKVYFPLAQAPRDVAVPPPPAARGTYRGRVFVAEDEAAVRSVINKVLVDAGFDVLEAGSGIEAARLADSLAEPIDLLITDVIMPGMTGPDLARHVLQRFPKTRILYITGYATHSAVPPSFMQQGDALLQKPFEPADLLARVRERLQVS